MTERYTVDDLKRCLDSGYYRKKLLLLRNGEFVGLFRIDLKNRKLKLWKTILDKPYGWNNEFKINESGEYGIFGGIDGLVHCNELHLIPINCKVSKKEDCLKLDQCLGGHYREVYRRLADAFPTGGNHD